MATKTGTITALQSSVKTISCTMDSNEFPRTIKLSANLTLSNSSTSSGTVYVYLTDSSKSVTCQFASLTISAKGTVALSSNSTYTINSGTSLKGKALYIVLGYSGVAAGNITVNGVPVNVTITTAVGVKAGDTIYATDRSQIGTSTTAGNSLTDSHFSSGTSASASTFNSQVLGI